MYFFIDHSRTPSYDFNLDFQENEWEVEIVRPCMFFCRGQKITMGKLKEYFTKHAIVKLEGDNYIKVNRDE